MTGGCTCPIYYQGVVSVDKGSMIIPYKQQACPIYYKRVVSVEKGRVIIRYKKN